MGFKLKSIVFAGLAAGLFSACSTASKETAPLDIAKVKPEIQAMEDAFAAAEKAKDAEKVVAYYSDDAISYSRNKEPLSGKAAIKEAIAKDLASDTTGNHSVYKVVDLFGEGNMLVEIGSWTKMSSAGAEMEKGHYMSYFQKKDGKYVCVRDMNVTSSPEKK